MSVSIKKGSNIEEGDFVWIGEYYSFEQIVQKPLYSAESLYIHFKGEELASLPGFNEHLTNFRTDFPHTENYTKLFSGLFSAQKGKLRYFPDITQRAKEIIQMTTVSRLRVGDVTYDPIRIVTEDSILESPQLVMLREDLPFDFYRRQEEDRICTYDESGGRRTIVISRRPYKLVPSRNVMVDDFVFKRRVGFQKVVRINDDGIVSSGSAKESEFFIPWDQCLIVPRSMIGFTKTMFQDKDSWNYDRNVGKYVRFEEPDLLHLV